MRSNLLEALPLALVAKVPLWAGAGQDYIALDSIIGYSVSSMKRALRLFLLLGALIGLFGQAVAYASIQPAMAASMTMPAMSDSGMSEDCMKMMAQQQQPAQKPCKGMTLACIAAMGCVVPMAVRNDVPTLDSRETDAALAFWPTTTVLLGSTLAPEPEPPTFLG